MPLNRCVTTGVAVVRSAAANDRGVGVGVPERREHPGALEQRGDRLGAGQLGGERHHPDVPRPASSQAPSRPRRRGRRSAAGVVGAPAGGAQERPLEVDADDRARRRRRRRCGTDAAISSGSRADQAGQHVVVPWARWCAATAATSARSPSVKAWPPPPWQWMSTSPGSRCRRPGAVGPSQPAPGRRSRAGRRGPRRRRRRRPPVGVTTARARAGAVTSRPSSRRGPAGRPRRPRPETRARRWRAAARWTTRARSARRLAQRVEQPVAGSAEPAADHHQGRAEQQREQSTGRRPARRPPRTRPAAPPGRVPSSSATSCGAGHRSSGQLRVAPGDRAGRRRPPPGSRRGRTRRRAPGPDDDVADLARWRRRRRRRAGRREIRAAAMPVPTGTKTRSSTSRPAPSRCSATPPAATSLPIRTGSDHAAPSQRDQLEVAPADVGAVRRDARRGVDQARDARRPAPTTGRAGGLGEQVLDRARRSRRGRRRRAASAPSGRPAPCRGVDQLALERGAADVDGEGELGGHGSRMMDRVRWRGWSASRPRSAARSTHSRWTLTSSATGRAWSGAASRRSRRRRGEVGDERRRTPRPRGRGRPARSGRAGTPSWCHARSTTGWTP